MSIAQRLNSQFKGLMYCLLILLIVGCANASTAQHAGFGDAKPIPDSTIATSDGRGVVAAMLSCATDRYAHAVLGDAIEAGCLVVIDDTDQSFTIELPASQVFEDLDPRIADIDGDGFNDVLVIRSDETLGAAMAIYTIKNNEAVELAATPPIGRAFRWLAPVGVNDFNNDGQLDIAYVQTPHIGGILKVWTINESELVQIAELNGFSNHSIGSKRVSTSRIIDYDSDGVVDIALPDQSRQNTVWITLSPELQVLHSKPYDESYFD